MKKISTGLLVPMALVFLPTLGCRAPQRCPPRPGPVGQRCVPAPCPPGAVAPPVFPGAVPAQPAPVVTTPGQIPAAPAVPPVAAPAVPPPHYPPETRQKLDYRWQPAENKVELYSPQPVPADDPSKDRIQFTPKGPEKTPALDKREPPKAGDVASPALPVGIPHFSSVKDKVASGLRPSIDDGLDWLQKNGYKTVLHLRLPSEEDQADRKQVENRGLAYLTLEVSPQILNKQIVDEFNRLVGDAKLRPLFVYDRNGSLAGGLWYLHFRLVEQLPDDTARIRANTLGLKEDADGDHRLMWLAVQKFLNEQGGGK